MSNADENKVDKKSESEKPCTVAIDIPPSMYLRHMDNLTPGKYDGTGEGGVLVIREMTKDALAAKVDMNTKSDDPDASNASKIDTTKIDVKIGIGKPLPVLIALYQRVSLRQQSLYDTQSADEGLDTGNFDATIDAKKLGKGEKRGKKI